MEELNSKNLQEEGTNTNDMNTDKPSYDQLKNWCDQLMMQRNQLAARLTQVTEVVNKLPWLFKVIENETMFSTAFVDSCVKEIQYIMTPPPSENTEEDKEKETESSETSK